MSFYRMFRFGLKRWMCSLLLVLTLLSLSDILLYVNREYGLDILWLNEKYGTRMADLNLSYSEIYQCFSLLHIVIGIAFMLEPLLEIVYFKYEVSKMRPRGRMMTGLECFAVTNKISDRFYSSPFALMSKPRKDFRRVAFGFGVFLTLSWLLMQI